MALTIPEPNGARRIPGPGAAARRRWCASALLAAAAALPLCPSRAADAPDRPYRLADIALGQSYETLSAALDFRDIQAAIAEEAERKAKKPDLGRRGYGCMRREDPYADVTCVSHDERLGGAELREIRLQFLDGVLQQFSVTAELRYFDLVMAAIRAEYGPPGREEPASAGAYASYRWRNGASSIVGYAGKDLVFVSFELASYAAAVEARKRSTGRMVVEPR
jgi:hypothetical protein